MPPRVIAVDPFDIVVVGATGDLAQRKLLPALFYRWAAGQVPADVRVVGVARRKMTQEAFRGLAREAIAAHVPVGDRDAACEDGFIEKLDYVAADADSAGGWAELGGKLGDDAARIRVFYLATGPDL